MFFCDYPILGPEKELPIYLINMGLQYCQDHILRKEGYPCPQILFCTKGSGTLIFDQKEYMITKNTAFFLPADYPHEYFANEDIWDIHWIVPGGNALPQLLSNVNLSHPSIFSVSETSRLEYLFRSMHESIKSDGILGNLKASGYLYTFLIEFNILISQNNAGYYYHPALIKAIDYIQNHYQEPITMEDLCNLSGVSKQHLCLLFRTSLHTRTMEYVTKKRLQVSKEYLANSSMTIEEIAEKTGFCTASYFCKMFKRHEGMTTTQFKRNLYFN